MRVIYKISVNGPVWLNLIQKLHLILNTGAGLQLLDHHLGGTETCTDLAQQNLRCIHRQGSVTNLT